MVKVNGVLEAMVFIWPIYDVQLRTTTLTPDFDSINFWCEQYLSERTG